MSRHAPSKGSDIPPAAKGPSSHSVLLWQAALADGVQALSYWRAWQVQGAIDSIQGAGYAALPMLYRTLKDAGAHSLTLRRLASVYRYYWSHNLLALETLTQILATLNSVAVDAILLKGAAHLVDEAYERHLRPVTCLDLLLPRDRIRPSIAALESSGWRMPFNSRRLDDTYMRAWPSVTLTRDDNVPFVLHWSPFQHATWVGAETDFQELAVPTTCRGQAAKVTAPTARLLHTCVHGRHHDGYVPFECVADGLAIIRRHGPAIDWRQLLDLAGRYQVTSLLFGALSYLVETFGAEVPTTVLSELRHRPASALERLLVQIAAETEHGRSASLRLRAHWLSHGQSLPSSSVWYRLRQFPAYCHRRWRLAPSNLAPEPDNSSVRT